MAKNPFRPGVGTRPPYLAGRDAQIRRFRRRLEDFPEKRSNVRVTGLRGVGKTVLLKEFERIAKREGWVVVRRDLSPRLCDEASFATATVGYLRDALDELSMVAKLKHRAADAARATIGRIDITMEGVSVTLGQRQARADLLEDRLRVALLEVGRLARGRGIAFLLDEAHTVQDSPKRRQFPLGSLLSALVAAQDDDDDPLPVLVVLCGLPPLIGNIHRARSNAERLFRAEQLGNLDTSRADGLSDAALALVEPVRDAAAITFTDDAADQIARDVDGYPFFVQWFGEALWDIADVDGEEVVNLSLYRTHRALIQHGLDDAFFEPRYRDARRADQVTLRVAGSLGGEGFEKHQIDASATRSSGAIAQSLNRLIADNLVYRDDHGVYAYTAPLFGDFLRRRHPRLADDG